jgi:chemotaxis protein methyltransferase CheR
MSIFDLILCRYVAFTYFAPPLQNRILSQILDRLSPDGYLVIGAHERIAAVETPLLRLDDSPQIFRKSTYAR